MAKPKTREEFAEYCLRALGKGMIRIEVTDEQVDDRIDEAVEVFNLYHYEGFFKTYLKRELTQEDIDNLYIEVDDNVQDVISMFDVGNHFGTSASMFNIGYQFALNDITGLRSGGSMTNYFLSRMHLENVHKILQGATPIRFNSLDNKIYFDMNRSRLHVGMYVVFEVYVKNTPELTPAIWKNVWLQHYATAKIKFQWGSNLTKMTGMMLPGNVQFNGEKILEDAKEELRILKEEVTDKLAPGAMDMYG